MPLRMTATNVTAIEDGLWRFDMPPHQVRHFGDARNSVGSRSVLVFSDYEFDASKNELHFNADDVTTINVGTLSSVIGLAAVPKQNSKVHYPMEKKANKILFGPGDREFLRMTEKELPLPMQKAALRLLSDIRARSPGDLKRGKSRNFSDSPDNFWYVIVQPRISQLSITVRGSVEHFKNVARLQIKDDRGNTRFKIRGEEDVVSALTMIFHAIRKRK
jgi:hypothetical protein